MSSMPIRVDGDLFESARVSGAAMSRSAVQQLSHWARLGRALEAASGLSQRDVARVLAGQAPYDDLGENEQAFVRAAWDERIDISHASLDLAAEFSAAGESWSEADAEGQVVIKQSQ